jgi:hypothetical protein
MQEQSAAQHVGGETVGRLLHLAGGVGALFFFFLFRGFDHDEELVAVTQFFADLTRGSPLRVAISKQVGEVRAGSQVVDIRVQQ